MSLLDRLSSSSPQEIDLDSPLSPQDSQSSTLVPVEKSLPVQRIEYVLNFLLADMGKDATGKAKRMQFMLKKIVAEALEEIGEVPAEMIEHYFTRAAHMMYWGATGMIIENMPLPPGFAPSPALAGAPSYRPELDEEAFAEIASEEYQAIVAAGRQAELESGGE